jgi:signal transduction histidine kinase
MAPPPTQRVAVDGHVSGERATTTDADVATLATRLEALETATIALTAEPALERLLQLIVDLVRPLVGAKYAALGTLGDDGLIDDFITSGISAETRRAIGDLPRGHGLLGLLIEQNQTIRVHDVMADDRRSGFPHAHPSMHTFLGTPVRVQGRSIGNLYLTEKEGGADFTDDDVRIVETFSRYAGIAIRNARLNAELERMAVVTERERIGQDLHDGVIQSLYAVGLSLEDMGELIREDPTEAEDRVESAIDAIHGTIRDLRRFIFGLRPEFLEEGDLPSALRALADEFRRTTLATVVVETVGDADVPPVIATTALQLAREALSNVARHSGASAVTIRLNTEPAELRLAVIDNGHGFDTERAVDAGHHGLSNMLDRARSAAGTLEVTSGSSGTKVLLVIPVEGVRPGRRETV